ncbi:hypothetical protein Tsubulata_017629 [Turnera subulata]|uniref:Uncharacterized protein n=1 Tax=Turnera subulata TaxID=218843 RepID=A0A9Q0GLE9_9ROSI|nr:hypothetical protein Tsubulata_017629 [Turnera subulata]
MPRSKRSRRSRRSIMAPEQPSPASTPPSPLKRRRPSEQEDPSLNNSQPSQRPRQGEGGRELVEDISGVQLMLEQLKRIEAKLDRVLRPKMPTLSS